MSTKQPANSRSSAALVLVVGAICALALIAGCTNDTDWAGPVISPPSTVRLDPGQRLILASLPDCEADLETMVSERREFAAAQERAVNEYQGDASKALGDSSDAATSAEGPVASTIAPMMNESSRDTGSADQASGETSRLEKGTGSEPAGDEDVVGTNVQEVGVDEADIIKTDGKQIITLRDGVLRVTGIGDTPSVLGTLRFDNFSGAEQMYLIGDKVFVVGSSFSYPVPPGTRSGGADRATADFDMAPSGTQLTEVDLTNPTRPTVIKSLTIEGNLVASRAIGNTVHAVLSGSSTEVLPMAVDESGKETTLGDCSSVRYETTADAAGKPTTTDFVPSSPSAPTLTILSFEDLTKPLEPTIIEGTGETVYASTESLYVASTVWDGNGEVTAIHRFELNANSPAGYVSSGLVSGALLNQFSMSEYDSALRVVTTISERFTPSSEDATTGPVVREQSGPAVIEPAPADQSVSAETVPSTTIPSDVEPVNPGDPATPIVPREPMPGGQTPRNTALTTLKVSDMTQLGQVNGLAPGESVKSSRFIGPMAYVVTFRQTDPLFAIDVSNPASPKVLGELKIPGFSEYLHPVGEGLLLGVGRDVDPTTTRDLGLKVSLFDVSDPSAPTEIDTWTLRDSYSPVSGDHHAFAWDPKRSRAILPVEGPCVSPTNQNSGLDIYEYCASARVLEVTNNKITQVAEISHTEAGTDGSGMPDRSVIVGQRLWTLSWLGLGYSPVDDPAAVTLIRFN